MLNTVLATAAAVVWGIAYGWFFFTDVRRWWKGRNQRRALAAYEREMARRAYAEWVRAIPPPPTRRAQLPPPSPAPGLPPPKGGVVVPFPRRAAGPRR